MPLTEDRVDFQPKPVPVVKPSLSLVEDRPGLVEDRPQQQAAAPVDPAMDRELRINQRVRAMIQPDPALDAYRSQKSMFDTMPDEYRSKAPQAPIITNYNDPRFQHLQRGLAQLNGGRTPSVDEVASLLGQQGYNVQGSVINQPGEAYDPNWALRTAQHVGIGTTELGGNILDLLGGLDPTDTGSDAFHHQATEARAGANELRGVYAPGRLPTQILDTLGESTPSMLMGMGVGKIASGLAGMAGASPAAQGTAAIYGAGAATGTLNAPSTYAQGIAAGLSPTEAMASAVASAGIEAGTSGISAKIPFLRQHGVEAILAPEGRKIAETSLRRVVAGAAQGFASDSIEEMIAQGVDAIRSKLAENPNLTLEDAINQVAVAGGAGGITGMGAEAGAKIGDRAIIKQDQKERPIALAALNALDPNSGGANVVPLEEAKPNVAEPAAADVRGDSGNSRAGAGSPGPAGSSVPNALVEDRPGHAQPVAEGTAEQPGRVADESVAAGGRDEGVQRNSAPDAGAENGPVRSVPEGDQAGEQNVPAAPAGNDAGNGRNDTGANADAEIARDVPVLPGKKPGANEAGAGSDSGKRAVHEDARGNAGGQDQGVGSADRPDNIQVADNGGSPVQEGTAAAPVVAEPAADNVGRNSSADAEAPQGPRLIHASPNATPEVQRAVERHNAEVSRLGDLPNRFAVRTAGRGYGPGNPKYDVPVRPDLTYAEFKRRIDPKDAAILDQSRGSGDASARLKERFGWTAKHNAASRFAENYSRGQERGDKGVVSGLRKTVGQFHQANNSANSATSGVEAGTEKSSPVADESRVSDKASAPARATENGVPDGQRGAGTADRGINRDGNVPRNNGGNKPGNDGRTVHRGPAGARNVTPRAGAETFALPKDLSKIAPRYGYKDRNFTVGFANDFDRATYALAKTATKSKAHDRILSALVGHTGLSNAELVEHGQRVRDAAKQLARDAAADDSHLDVPAQTPPAGSAASAENPSPVTGKDIQDTIDGLSDDERFFKHYRGERDSVTRDQLDAAPRRAPKTEVESAVVGLGDSLGVPVELAALPEGVDGIYDPKTGRIVLSDSLGEAEAAGVFGHELSHAAVHSLSAAEKTRLIESAREQLGSEAITEALAAAKKRWGDQSDPYLIEELISEGGSDLINRRGIAWLQADRSIWTKIQNWVRGAVDSIRATLGDHDAKWRRLAESTISQFAESQSTALQNGTNLLFNQGSQDTGLKHAIRNLAETDDRFLASTQRKIEMVVRPLSVVSDSLATSAAAAGLYAARSVLIPSYVAAKHPEFAPIFMAGRKKDERQIKFISNVDNMTKTFMGLRGKSMERVNKILEEQRLGNVNYSANQLQAKGLNTQEITAVNEVRRALDYVYDAKEASVWQRFGVPPVGLQALKAQQAAATAAGNTRQATRLQALGEIVEQMRQNKRDGYIPFQRIGNYRKITVKDANGDVLYYTHTTGFLQNRKVVKELNAQFPNETIDVARIIQKQDLDSYNLHESDLLALAKNANVPRQKVQDLLDAGVDAYLVKETFERYLQRSKDTPGYSKDFQQSIAQYALSAANGITSTQFAADTQQAFNSLAGTDSSLHAYATDWKNYILDKQGEAAAVNQLAFHMYLGFNAASAVTNLTQVPLVTVPFLFGISGNAGVVTRTTKAAFDTTMAAMEEMAKNGGELFTNQSPTHDMVEEFAKHVTANDPQLAAALRAARNAGIMVQSEARAFTSRAGLGGGSAANALSRGLHTASGFMFSKSERMVRLASFVAAFKTAREHKNDQQFWARANNFGYHGAPGDAAAFAAFTVDETQGIYGKQNRPELFRGTLAPLYVFRQFGVNMAYFLYKMAKLAAKEPGWKKLVGAPAGGLLAYFLAMQAAGGIWSTIPGGNAIKGGVDFVWSQAGPKRSLEAEVSRMLGDGRLAKIVNEGALGELPGVAGQFGPTIGRRAGLGNLIPASTDAGALLGPGAGAVIDAAGAVGQLVSGDPWAAGEGFSTLVAGRAGGSVARAARAALGDRGYQTKSGTTLVPKDQLTATDIAGLAVGLPSTHLTDASKLNLDKQRLDSADIAVQKDFVNRILDADAANDQATVNKIQDEIMAHNAEAMDAGRYSEVITKEGFQSAMKNEYAERKLGVFSPRGASKKTRMELGDRLSPPPLPSPSEDGPDASAPAPEQPEE